MANLSRVFISFSSKDIDAVRRVFYRLKSQNINIWDYSQKGQEIPWGREIPEYLKQQIESSDFLIAIVSENSANPNISPYCHLEIEYGISQNFHTQGRILPLVLSNKQPKMWERSYASLKKLRYFEIDTEESNRFEATIAQICRFLNVSYISPFIAHARLPFAEKFQKEIKKWELTVAQHEELMLIVDAFSRQYKDNDFINAEKTIIYFLDSCQYKLPDLQPYYPLVVMGVCQLHLGKFLEAEETFLEAIDHPKLDENAYGGLGQVYFRQRRFREALYAFEKALELCPAHLNREIKFNKLGALIELDQDIADISFLDSFKVSELGIDEWIKLYNMKGIAYFKRNEWKSALKIFEFMHKEDKYNYVSVIYQFLAMQRLDKGDAALKILERETDKLHESILYHYLAHTYWKNHRIQEAISIYKNYLLALNPNSRQYNLELAQLIRNIDYNEMTSICKKVLNPKYFPLPKSKKDFYYDGFANYLLGEKQRARYDFERSREFSHTYYDNLLFSF